MDFLIIGGGMFGAATARHLAPHASVTVISAGAPAGPPGPYGAHHDEGRITGDLGRDEVWSELNRRARDGMTGLDPAMITPCGALSATSRSGAGYLGAAARAGGRPGAEILTAAAARSRFPMARFRPDEMIVYQPAAGHFSPRHYVAAATEQALAHGATVIPGTVRALEVTAAGAQAQLGDGRRVRATAAIVATGSFAAGPGLLPVPVAVRAKSEVYVMAEVGAAQAADLGAMPCINRAVDHPQVADLYVLPPIRYRDGRTYVKIGANTMIDHWLPGPAAVRAWYDHGDDHGPSAALREALTGLLPGLRARAWHTRRCSDAYTAHRHPYIDTLGPGLTVALGGNGRGAQAGDAVGELTAGLALTGRWPSDLPRDAFRQVASSAAWNGLILFRDQAR